MAPTYTEFYDEVRKDFKALWLTLTDEEVDKYLKEEGEYIKKSYEDGVEDYTKKRITRKQFLIGRASAIAYSLSMLY